MAMIRIKRIYSEPSPHDGVRILVDRVWPRGRSKEQARLDEWRKDLAPSTALRKWFGHDPRKWIEFRTRYRMELSQPEQSAALKELARRAGTQTITLLYGTSNAEQNQAVVLKELLDGMK
ncbi:MAG: DUF488 domain-containing protein [Nitrospira defluvii]|nr:DUF488 domain-containing protein [Nitrospira defluvii]